MGRRRNALPRAVDGQSLRTADAELWGIARSRRRRDDIGRPFRGVATIGAEPSDIAAACATYEAVRLPGQFYSHTTAAALHGIPLPLHERTLVLHVSVEAPRTAPRRPGVIGHSVCVEQLPAASVTELPVAAPADTWCQLASLLSPEDLVAAGDYLISERRIGPRRLPPLSTVDELQRVAQRYRGARGAKRIAWALPRLRTGVASAPESHLRLLLVGSGLPEPLVADPTEVEGGMLLHPDLKYSAWHLVLEYEGDGHRTDTAQWRRDITRREMLEAAGWRVIRVTADDLYRHPAQLVARIRRIIAAR